MSKPIRALSVLAIATITIAAANTALAIGHNHGHHRGAGLPKFGFVSHNTGHGEHVTRVLYGSRAHRLGLETHDTIMAINGRPLNYVGSWYDVLREATYQGDYMTLTIRDRRTGRIVYRTISVWGGAPPVVYKHRRV